LESTRVVHGLVVQQVEFAHPDPGGCQTGQVVAAGGTDVGAGVVEVRRGAQVGAPTELVRRRCQQQAAARRIFAHPVVAQRRSIVELRADQRLGMHTDAFVQGPLRDDRGQPGAGAGPGDHDALWVDVEVIGAFVHPAQYGHAVVEGGRIGMFGCQSVVGGHDDRIQCPGPSAADDGLGLRRAVHDPAAVQIEHAGAGAGAVGSDDQNGNGRLTGQVGGRGDLGSHRRREPAVHEAVDTDRPRGILHRDQHQRAAQRRRHLGDRVAQRQVAAAQHCGQ